MVRGEEGTVGLLSHRAGASGLTLRRTCSTNSYCNVKTNSGGKEGKEETRHCWIQLISIIECTIDYYLASLAMHSESSS
jgi:hypothetical protein